MFLHTNQNNLQIECSPYQNTYIFHRTKENNSKIYSEAEMAPNSQSNSKRKEQSCRCHPLKHQTALQSCSDQKSVVLVKKKKDTQMNKSEKWNKDLRNKCMTYGQLPHNKGGKNIQRWKTFSSVSVARKTEQLLMKEWNIVAEIWATVIKQEKKQISSKLERKNKTVTICR